jgi:phosphate-selective porin OprO/OprP
MGTMGRRMAAAAATATAAVALASAAWAQDGEAPAAPVKSLEERVAELEKLVKKDQGGLTAYWKNGLRLESADGDFKLRIGGRIQGDWSWFSHQREFEAATASDIQAGTEFRRARIMVGGTLYKDFEFMGEYDFAQGTAKFREVWIGAILGKAARVKVGSVKEPFGFEEMVSDLFTTFMERSACDEAFCPVYNTGVLFTGTLMEKRMWWGAGVFRDANDFGDDVGNTRSGEWAATARVAGRPWIADEGRRFLHVGAAVSRRVPPDDTVRFRARPELHLVSQVVDTGSFAATGVCEAALESAFAWGPFSATAEGFQAEAAVHGATDPTFRGWAVQASWFLTGEGRPYDPEKAAFDRVIPKSNALKGRGAWEIAARMDRLDLDDAGVNGGTQDIATVGVNWYLTPNVKIQIDHVRVSVHGIGVMYGYEMRFQVDF